MTSTHDSTETTTLSASPEPASIRHRFSQSFREALWAYRGNLLDSGGCDSVLGVITGRRTAMVALGYSLGWTLQKGLFEYLPDKWNELHPEDQILGVFNGMMGADDEGGQYFIVDIVYFINWMGFDKVRAVLCADGAFDAMDMSNAINFPPWQ